MTWPLKAVLFDLDGVLVETREATHAFFRRVFQSAGIEEPTSDQLEASLSMTMRDFFLQAVRGEQSELLRLLSVASSLDYPMDLVQIPTGITQTLSELGRRYLVGVVTSRIGRDATRLVGIAGLRLHTLVAFEDYTLPKPDPQPLLLACRNLGVAPRDAVYVGDAEVDVVAARAAPMRVIHVAVDSGCPADAHVSHPSRLHLELPALLSAMS